MIPVPDHRASCLVLRCCLRNGGNWVLWKSDRGALCGTGYTPIAFSSDWIWIYGYGYLYFGLIDCNGYSSPSR